MITENVDDFATVNLVECGLSAVTADLFMAARFSATAYQEALTVLTAHRVRPPDTPAEMHRALGRQHPRLASRYAHVFRSQLQAPAHPEPKFLFRGDRCLYCGQRQDSPPGLESGRCDSC
ncbi:MAG: hypothetical protein LBJ44_09095 [Propionibacteriaceae bacterium]|nr:hypothetical protein [Propionibacteriaceae bacterium]